MRAFSEPLERVLDQVRLLLGMRELRAMHVRTSPQLLPVMVGAVAACESKGGNTAPMVVLLTPALLSGHGWKERTAELCREHRDLARAAEEAGVQIPSLQPPRLEDVSGFAQALASALASLPEPLADLVVVLAPREGAGSLVDDLRALWSQPPLARARWIVLESTHDLRGPVEALGDRGLLVDAVPSTAEIAAELERMAENVAAAPAGATGPAAAGCAGPGVAPPRRPHEGPATPLDILQREVSSRGVASAHADPEVGKRVRVAVLRAMSAAASRDLPAAIAQFGIARDAASEAGLTREAVTYEVMMASLAIEGAPAEALRLFGSARERAKAAGDQQLSMRAELGRAGALVALRRPLDAAESYRVAAEIAAPVEPIMAIEAYRMGGQLLAAQHQDQAAVVMWRRALDLAERTAPAQRIGSTAPEVARALAAVCDRHGLKAQAASLRAQATVLDTPPDIESLHPTRVLASSAQEGAD